jgi:riboflavin kinase/FMN adenylyltransferase
MRIVTIDMKHLQKISTPVAACIGYFDGLHLGHQALIRKTKELAAKYHCETALITFDPDPMQTILKGAVPIRHLTNLRQKINLCVDLGIENIYILRFCDEMAALEPAEFVGKVLGTCNLQALVCGFDWSYGIHGSGSWKTLKEEAPYEVAVVDAVVEDGVKISSTRIRQLIEKGNVAHAGRLLGYPYEIEGTVIDGMKIGRELGFPTANIEYSQEAVIPHAGVYACRVAIQGRRYAAMVNIGHNPTLNYTAKLSMEAHILDFKQNIYGSRVTVQFLQFIREEKKFQNRTNLIMQLEQDLRDVRKITGNE